MLGLAQLATPLGRCINRVKIEAMNDSTSVAGFTDDAWIDGAQ